MSKVPLPKTQLTKRPLGKKLGGTNGREQSRTEQKQEAGTSEARTAARAAEKKEAGTNGARTAARAAQKSWKRQGRTEHGPLRRRDWVG